MPPTADAGATRRRAWRGAIMAGIEAWRWERASPCGSHLDELTKHSIRIESVKKWRDKQKSSPVKSIR
jgi:hypothetical protein